MTIYYLKYVNVTGCDIGSDREIDSNCRTEFFISYQKALYRKKEILEWILAHTYTSSSGSTDCDVWYDGEGLEIERIQFGKNDYQYLVEKLNQSTD